MTDNKSGEILIIEDDKDINDLLATALSKAGYRTRQAWSGTEGELLLKLDREAYALVLLDLMLPGLSGEELLARIRQMDASLPVIILTAKDELDEKINLLVAGADDYITKPFEMFWATGALSSFLDNTPTYLVFLTTAGAMHFTTGVATTLGVVPVKMLMAISCGAVFMGANTYIGNAPNFMVKSLSDENGINMPSFFGYIWWSLRYLIPVFIIDMIIFFL